MIFERAISLKYRDWAGVLYFCPGSIISDRSFPLLTNCIPPQLGDESGVSSTLVSGVDENSLTSPGLLSPDSYSPSEQPKCCTGVVTTRKWFHSDVAFKLVISPQLIESTLEQVATQLEIHVDTWCVQP